MKQKVFFILAMLLGILVPQGAKAYSFSAVAPTGQTLYYNISGSTVEVTYPSSYYYNGNHYSGYTRPSGDLEIPSSVTNNNTTYTVTSIGYCAFHGCSGLTSVTIPNSVTSIGDYAFFGCSGLTGALTIPNSVTSIGEYAFDGCSGLTSVTIPNSVTSIGNAAFYGCSGLTGALTIPNSVTSIGDYAFSSCSGLTSLNVPSYVTFVGENAFQGIRLVAYSGELTGCPWGGTLCCVLEDSLFFSDASKTTVIGCMPELHNVIIPNSVTSIGNNAFYSCSGLTSVSIGNSVTSIGNNAFYSCSGLTSVSIGNSVTSIGNNAFDGCSGLTSVTIPNSVTSIGAYAFQYCSGLTSLTLGNSVTSIGYCAFHGCSGLTSVTIPNSVTSIGAYAFQYCSGLTALNFNADSCGGAGFSSSTSDHWLSGCTSLTTLNIGNTVRVIPNSAFYGRSGLTSVTIGNSVTSIEHYAFYNCWGLTSVTIPNSVTSIGDRAFYNCRGLTSVTIPNSVTSIGNAAFYGCSGLTLPVFNNHLFAYFPCGYSTTYTIPDGISQICSSSFSGCTSLTSITIPNSVTSIGDYAFSGCSGLTTLNFNADSCGGNGFYYELPGVYYSYASWLSGCTSLTTVSIGNNVRVIPAYAFYHCSGLTSVTIPNSVTSIGQCAFQNCSGLTHAIVGIGVDSIQSCTFQGCTSLSELDLGSSLRYVGQNAFYNCDRLEGITSRNPNPPTVADTNAFHNVWRGLPLTVPFESTSRYMVAYAWRDFTNIQEEDNSFAVTVTSSDVTMGSVMGGGTYQADSIAIIAAIPNNGYRFDHWQDSVTSNPRNVTVVTNQTYTAYFATYDTLHDTTIVYVTDTLWQHDTVFVHDTIFIYDTIYVGVDEVETVNAKIYTSNGQIVVEGAQSNTVWLFDVNGRVLATKQDEYSPLHFDVPTLGTYLVKIGSHPARKVVVIR